MGKPKGAVRRIWLWPAPAKIGPFRRFIGSRRLSTGKDQRAGCKIDLVMPLDHQHLELRLVAKQQHGGCGDRIDWLLQCHHKLKFSVGLILDAGPYKLSTDIIAY